MISLFKILYVYSYVIHTFGYFTGPGKINRKSTQKYRYDLGLSPEQNTYWILDLRVCN